ncbi:MAG: thiamine phosphate synthase [Myxococcota bacterium]
MSLPFRIVLVTDWSLDDLPGRVARALEAGPGVAVQHRHPGASDRQLLEEALRLADVCRAAGAPLFVSRRLDVALALDAHLHLPAYALRVADVRPRLPAGRLVSVAIHDEAEALAARGADFALVSPVYAPGSKPTDTRPTLGPDGFRRLAAALPCPAFALGGLDASRARALAPVAGAAVVSAVLAAADPLEACRAMLDALPSP